MKNQLVRNDVEVKTAQIDRYTTFFLRYTPMIKN